MTFLSMLSSFIPTAYNDTLDHEDQKTAVTTNSDPHTGEGEQTHEDKEDKEEEGGEQEEAEEEEPEEEEVEDIMPSIREECANSKHCISAKREFEHCEKKVRSGEGRPHEDCVEEMFHMMHCVDNCSAPKLFSKLR